MNERSEVIRIIFAHRVPNMNTVFEELLDVRKVYAGTQPFFFLNSEPRPFRNTELVSLQVLRQMLLEINFMFDYCFADVPIAVIHFVRDSETVMRSIQEFPKWALKIVNEVQPFIVKEGQNIPESLRQFLDDVVLPWMEVRLKKTHDNFARAQRDLSKPTKASAKTEIAMKFYADSLFQQRKFAEAQALYRQLFDGAIWRSAQAMCAMSMIASGGNEAMIVDCLNSALKGNKDSIQVLALLLVKFKVKRNYQDWKKFEKVTKKFPILKPFIFEQKCFMLQERHAALSFLGVANQYESLGCTEYATRCRWRAWCASRCSGFDLLNQLLVEDIVKQANGANITRVIEQTITHSRKIFHPDILGEYIMKVISAEAISCGFADVRVAKSRAIGFPCCEPDGVVSNEMWPRLAQQLFGAFDRDKFFNYNVFKLLECAVGEEVPLTVFLKSRCSMFPFSNLSLLIDPKTKCSVQSTEIEYPTNEKIELSFTPLEPGQVEILGVQFDWLTMHCHCFFDNPIVFTCYDDSPMIEVNVDLPKTDLVNGEIVEIDIQIKNGQFPLKYLAMMTLGTVRFEVLEPTNEEVLGQRFLKRLESGEVFRIRVAVCGIYDPKKSTQTLTFIFPFWTHHPPARYKSCSLVFNVKPALEFPLFCCDSEVVAQPPLGCTALGFTSTRFEPERHVTSFVPDKCQLCLIAHSSSCQSYEIPDFCRPFVADNDTLLFWYKTDKSVVFSSTPDSDNLLSASISCTGPDKYTITVRNITSRTIKDINVSVIEASERITFILSGATVKLIDALAPGEAYSYSFGLIPLTDIAKPVIMLTGDNIAMIHPVVFPPPK